MQMRVHLKHLFLSNTPQIVELKTLCCMPLSATLVCLNASQSVVTGVPKLTPGYATEDMKN